MVWIAQPVPGRRWDGGAGGGREAVATLPGASVTGLPQCVALRRVRERRRVDAFPVGVTVTLLHRYLINSVLLSVFLVQCSLGYKQTKCQV